MQLLANLPVFKVKGENQKQTQACRTIGNGEGVAHFERAVSNWHSGAKREIQATRYRKFKIGVNVEVLSHALMPHIFTPG